MAKDQTKRLNLKKLNANDAAFAALQDITTYAPADANYRLPMALPLQAL